MGPECFDINVTPKKIQRGKKAGQIQREHTTLQMVAKLLPEVERLEFYPPRYNTGSLKDPTGGKTKEQAAEAFGVWAEAREPWDVTVYSDGSKIGWGLGYGFTVYEGTERVDEGQRGMELRRVVFDAEALGAFRGIQKALERDLTAPITFCVDNTGAIWSSQKNASDTL